MNPIKPEVFRQVQSLVRIVDHQTGDFDMEHSKNLSESASCEQVSEALYHDLCWFDTWADDRKSEINKAISVVDRAIETEEREQQEREEREADQASQISNPEISDQKELIDCPECHGNGYHGGFYGGSGTKGCDTCLGAKRIPKPAPARDINPIPGNRIRQG